MGLKACSKVNSAYYIGRLLPLPSLVDECTRLLPSGSGYIFQQDGAPARATQNWLQTNCPDFIAKDHRPPNSPDLNPLDYHVWGQCWSLEASYHKRHPKPKTITELKEVLQVIWDSLYLSDQ